MTVTESVKTADQHRETIVRDGRLITGQQQFSGMKVGEAVVAALGV